MIIDLDKLSIDTTQSPWVHSYVCGRWRRICLLTPLLWSHVRLFNVDPDGNKLPVRWPSSRSSPADALLEQQLARARGVALSITFRTAVSSGGDKSTRLVFQNWLFILLQHVHLWKTAEILTHRNSSSAVGPEAWSSAPPIPLPNVESLTIREAFLSGEFLAALMAPGYRRISITAPTLKSLRISLDSAGRNQDHLPLVVEFINRSRCVGTLQELILEVATPARFPCQISRNVTALRGLAALQTLTITESLQEGQAAMFLGDLASTISPDNDGAESGVAQYWPALTRLTLTTTQQALRSLLPGIVRFAQLRGDRNMSTAVLRKLVILDATRGNPWARTEDLDEARGDLRRLMRLVDEGMEVQMLGMSRDLWVKFFGL